jgi:hypothetical protein
MEISKLGPEISKFQINLNLFFSSGDYLQKQVVLYLSAERRFPILEKSNFSVVETR